MRGRERRGALASPERGGAQCAHWGGGGAADGRGSPRRSASPDSVGAAISRPLPRFRRGRRPRRPADLRPCPTNGLSRAPAPTQQTKVPRVIASQCAHWRGNPHPPSPGQRERIATPNPSVTGASAGDTPKTPFRGGKAHWLAMTHFGVCLHIELRSVRSAGHRYFSLFIFHFSSVSPSGPSRWRRDPRPRPGRWRRWGYRRGRRA